MYQMITLTVSLKRLLAGGDKNNYESIVYEGYGPNGVAVIVECLTDNKNRTAGDIRHYFDKFGGNLGTSGCVSFLFSEKGMVVLENTGLDEDTVMEDCFAFDADDLSVEEDVVEISCEPSVLPQLRDGLAEKGYHILSAEVEQIPATYTTLTDEDQIKKMNLLLEHLEETTMFRMFIITGACRKKQTHKKFIPCSECKRIRTFYEYASILYKRKEPTCNFKTHLSPQKCCKPLRIRISQI